MVEKECEDKKFSWVDFSVYARLGQRDGCRGVDGYFVLLGLGARVWVCGRRHRLGFQRGFARIGVQARRLSSPSGVPTQWRACLKT